MTSATLPCRLFFLFTLIAAPSIAWSGPHRGEPGVVGGFGRPAFLEHVFRPELVMRHQQALGISDEQRETITQAIRDTQQRLLALQWQLEARSEEAAPLFAAGRVDEGAALARANAVMEVEGEIKREHLRLLIRIKNVLTAEQQDKLRAMRPSRCSPRAD